MRILAVHARVEHFPLSRPYSIAYKSLDAVSNVIVSVQTDGDPVGLGAASPSPHVTGETIDTCAAALAPESVEWLVGRDTAHVAALCRELEWRLPDTPAARAALDMALHDALAQQMRVPLADLLGRVQDALPTSVTIGILPEDETLAEAREHVGRGFRILKLKLGSGIEEDIARVRRVREEVGPLVGVRVDANQAWTRGDLLRFLHETRDALVELIEQPLPAGAADGLRDLPEADRRRLCADETLLGPADAWRLAQAPAPFGIFNIKLVKCGGIRAALRIAEVADLAGIELMWGCMDESVISIAAALHAALACPATRYLDLDGHLDLARDVVAGGVTIEGGFLRTTGRPGLGLRALA